MEWIVFALAAGLCVLHWFSEHLAERVERFHTKIVSFSSGLFVAYLFLFLFPEWVQGVDLVGEKIYFYLLVGFAAFHLLEKYVYQHVRNKRDMLKDLAELHALGFFLDHFIVGAVLYFAFVVEREVVALFVVLPLVLHTLMSSMSLNHLDAHYEQNRLVGAVLALSPLIGVAFSFLLSPPLALHYSYFSFALGAILYIVVRDLLPEGRAGDARLFLGGTALTVTIYLAVELLRAG